LSHRSVHLGFAFNHSGDAPEETAMEPIANLLMLLLCMSGLYIILGISSLALERIPALRRATG